MPVSVGLCCRVARTRLPAPEVAIVGLPGTVGRCPCSHLGRICAYACGMMSSRWPAIGVEERTWQSKIPPDLVSARVRQRHSGPYLAAVVPEIARQSLHLPADVTTLAEDASIEIARFDAELGAEVAPFASVLLRSESASSSRKSVQW